MPFEGFGQVEYTRFGGLMTYPKPESVPIGWSPNLQNVRFKPGLVETRPGLTQRFSKAGANQRAARQFIDNSGVKKLLTLDASGDLDKESGAALVEVKKRVATPDAMMKSETAFGREFLAFYGGTLSQPRGPIRQFDSQGNLDPFVASGPGKGPQASDSTSVGAIIAGVHKVSVIFETRHGYLTEASPASSWTAAGNKKAILSEIPTGPDYVVARRLIFTPANSEDFYFISVFRIPDNIATAVEVDFTDGDLILGDIANSFFNQFRLPDQSGIGLYNLRMAAWGGLNTAKLINLGFDGGFDLADVDDEVSNGVTAASQAGSGDVPWTSPANALTFNSTHASVEVDNSPSEESENLVITGFNFAAIPSTAIIRGVKLRIRSHRDGIASALFTLRLVKAGTIAQETQRTQSMGTIPLADEYTEYGGPTDKWNTTLSRADVVDSGFGMAVRLVGAGLVTLTTEWLIDHIELTVFWSLGGEPLGWRRGEKFDGGERALSSESFLGESWKILGDGAASKRGEIWHPEAATELKKETAYTVSVRVKRQGASSAIPHLIVDLLTPLGPATAPAGADSATAGTISAGVHKVAVIFETESGVLTQPSPIAEWTAAGSKKGSITIIPTGPSHVVARRLIFTPANSSDFYYLDSFRVPDNTTTTLEVDFTDAQLIAGTLSNGLFGTVDTMGLELVHSSVATEFAEFQGELTSGLSEIPGTLVLRVMVEGIGGIPSAGVGFIVDHILVYPSNEKFDASTLRFSDPDDPERFDGVNGLILVSKDDGQRIIASAQLRSFYYIFKERSMHVTVDDGFLPPSLWSVSLVDSAVGAASPNSVGVGQGFLAIASRRGPYIFSGGRPFWAGKEIISTWARINWQVAETIHVIVDSEKSHIYFFVPLDADTEPKNALVLDYNEGLGGEDNPGGRKWSLDKYPFAVRASTLIEKANNSQATFLAGASGGADGKVYENIGTSDDGAAIESFYETAYAKAAKGGQDLFGGIALIVTGAGTLTAKLIGLQDTSNHQFPDTVLALAPGKYVEQYGELETEMARLRIGTNAVAERFELTRAAIYARLWAEVRPK